MRSQVYGDVLDYTKTEFDGIRVDWRHDVNGNSRRLRIIIVELGGC